MLSAEPSVKGVDKASAQGQAIINTAVNTDMAISALTDHQRMPDTTAIPSTASVKWGLMRSASDVTLAFSVSSKAALFQSLVR